MEINYLKEFVVLAQTSNFLEAAHILYSSQSTLSKHIKKMETELGVPLFARTTRKVRISKYGQLLLPYAKQIVELQDRYTTAIQSCREDDRHTLTIGSIYGLAQYKITNVLVKFKNNHPQVTLNVLQDSTGELTEMLRRRKCELAIIRDIEDEDDEFIKLPFITDTIVAVLPINHRFANQKTIPLQLLADENFLLTVEGTLPHQLSMKAFKRSGIEPRVTYNDPEAENLVDLVAKGMGVSLLLKQIVMYRPNPKTAVVDITPGILSEINICYPKDDELSDAARRFIKCVGV